VNESSFSSPVFERLAGGPANLTLTYDPEGRLASYTSGSTLTTFLYDGVDLIGEYNGAGQLQRRYVHGSATDDPVMWYEGSGTSDPRYFYTNHQGSIIGYANAAGTLLDVYKYGYYGEPKGASNGDSWTGARFRYTGQTMLPEAKLYYYKARVYDPAAGRFLQTDPIGSQDDLNLYAYVSNDPLGRTDPSGLWICDMKNEERRCMDVAAGLGRLRTAEQKITDGQQRTRLHSVLKLWGKFGDKGVNVKFASGMNHPADSTLAADGVSVDITFNTEDLDAMNFSERAAVIAHEGSHGIDKLALVAAGDYARLVKSMRRVMDTERKAYRLESWVDEALGNKSFLWSPGMSKEQRDRRIEDNAYESFLEDCAPWNPGGGCTAP
jgi:RHS repeat-associated protein